MASYRRIEKLNNLLKEEVAKILDRESNFGDDSFITVTKVSVSRDLRYGAVFISVFDKESAGTLENLQKNVYHIQKILNRRLRMRPVPQIHFLIDEEETKRERVEKTLAELKRKGDI